jgi:hypothetical protein
MIILVVMKILTAITRGRDDSDKGKAMMIKNDSAPMNSDADKEKDANDYFYADCDNEQ